MMNANNSSRELIIVAARKEFVKKGFAGARMQSIADAASINKGLLHYYFKTKDSLFSAVFATTYNNLIPCHDHLLKTNSSIFRKIEDFVDCYISELAKSPESILFVLNELNRLPNHQTDSDVSNDHWSESFFKEVRHRSEVGAINNICPKQLYINMVSLCVFPFIGGKIMQNAANLTEEEFNELLAKRKKEVTKFIINALQR